MQNSKIDSDLLPQLLFHSFLGDEEHDKIGKTSNTQLENKLYFF